MTNVEYAVMLAVILFCIMVELACLVFLTILAVKMRRATKENKARLERLQQRQVNYR